MRDAVGVVERLAISRNKSSAPADYIVEVYLKVGLSKLLICVIIIKIIIMSGIIIIMSGVRVDKALSVLEKAQYRSFKICFIVSKKVVRG